MEITDQIRELVMSRLTNESQFIVDVVIKGHNGPKKVLVVLDGDKGVTIDDCANLSRELAKAFDDMQLFEESYTLEVSTPGLDQPLKLRRQYRKNVGRRLKLVTQQGIVEGKLIEVTEDKVALEEEVGTGKEKQARRIDIPFSNIEKTFVLISFK